MLTAYVQSDLIYYFYKMKSSSYRRILYFIGAVILITLAIQVYWNYRNYQVGKQHLINEVQISLDNAVEEYYATSAKRQTRVYIRDLADSLPGLQAVKGDRQTFTIRDHVALSRPTDTFPFKPGVRYNPVQVLGSADLKNIESIQVIRGEENIKLVESKVGRILMSMREDTLNMKKMDSLVQQELNRKGIGVAYGLQYICPSNREQIYNSPVMERASLSTDSKSTWLPSQASLSLYFTNETATILKQNIAGILLSALLLGAVIGCLLFLLKVINNQKQLAEIKNDFISNLTHEFKTPISTIKVAMEGILNFNMENDPYKTEKYVKTSYAQVEKLDGMVEKLLEVATLNGNRLELQKEQLDLVVLARQQVQKYAHLDPDKKFDITTNKEEIHLLADPFHLENVFNNILDNAFKYGGSNVMLTLTAGKDKIEVVCSDSGKGLSRSQSEQIFDKFYRVPKGNTHDVKGYGIGLYYSRQIVERHGGNIKAEVGKNTQIIIELPYE